MDYNDPDFSLKLKMISSFTFVPEQDVIQSFEMLQHFQWFQDNEKILAPLTDYFEDTWVGRSIRQNRRPKYALSLWNQILTRLENLPKTK